MSKNLFHKIKESLSSFNKKLDANNKERDFEKAKEVLFSSKNQKQLISAVKYINNFNQKYRITENSPEFIYFDRMILAMKLRIRGNKGGIDEQIDDEQRMGDDFDWIRSSESDFDPNFEFKDFEYWIDLSTLTAAEIKVVGDYILKVLTNINLSGDRARKFSNLRRYQGIIIHCGSDTTDYEPEKNNLCFMDIPFEEDENIENSVYVDGREVLEYIKSTEEDEELDESLEWVDKDNTYGGDEKFSTDPTWKGDDSWSTNPERSYWKQGDTGSSGGGEDVNESDEDWSWIEDTGEHPNYNGHPQGVVYLYDHDEIDEFCDIIENYNGGELPRGNVRYNLHQALEHTRDELESSDYDPSNAVISASFFVERKVPGVLSVGYWGYEVNERDIYDWLYHDNTFNREYHLYSNLDQVRKVFEDYQNPELIKESEGDLDWIKDVPGEEGYGEKYRFFDIYVCFPEYDDDDFGCDDGYSAFIKIPKYEVDILWDGELYDHRYEGMDGFDEIIKWVIDNKQFDSEDYSAVQYVSEIDKDDYIKATGDPDLLS